MAVDTDRGFEYPDQELDQVFPPEEALADSDNVKPLSSARAAFFIYSEMPETIADHRNGILGINF